MNQQKQDKKPVVVLTGPTKGLGRSLFEQLVSQGFPLLALGRDLLRISGQAENAYAPVRFFNIDLGDPNFESVFREIDQSLLQSADQPLVFISNAGTIEPIGLATNIALPNLEHAMRINCLAPLLIARTMANIANLKQKKFLILNISTGAANHVVRGWLSYCTSKAAYKMALDILAEENTYVNVVHFDPGVMDTNMQRVIRQQAESDMPDVSTFLSFNAEGALKDPNEVADKLIRLMNNSLS